MRRYCWVWVGLWAALIGSFSTEVFSRDETVPYVVVSLQSALPDVSRESLFHLSCLLRKSVHPLEYFLLSLLLLQAIRGPRDRWQLRWAASALLLSAICATADEYHQMFVPNRTGSAGDILLDVTGAALSQIIAWQHCDAGCKTLFLMASGPSNRFLSRSRDREPAHTNVATYHSHLTRNLRAQVTAYFFT